MWNTHSCESQHLELGGQGSVCDRPRVLRLSTEASARILLVSGHWCKMCDGHWLIEINKQNDYDTLGWPPQQARCPLDSPDTGTHVSSSLWAL